MPGDENQRQAFEFFVSHFDSQEPFTKDDLADVTTWAPSALNTYWSKQFRPFLKDAPSGRFRVSEAFRLFSDWELFRAHVTQVRYGGSDYTPKEYDSVMVFEFFMPLTNETALRGTLDSLFYKDTILWKLKGLDISDLHEQVDPQTDESTGDYLDRLCLWVADRFIGYSISHVAGRFRGEKLSTRPEAAEIEKRRRYLVDETTAVTRFIFPCEDAEDAARVRWFFNSLFVESIKEVVSGEDEIWMLESGLRNRLHIWRIEETN